MGPSDESTSKTWEGVEVEQRGGSVSGGPVHVRRVRRNLVRRGLGGGGGAEDFSRAMESMFSRMMQVMFDSGLECRPGRVPVLGWSCDLAC